ncbi:hypothetical protein EVAR_93916_1 [Eumeta japonica]|uniref:Retrotransposon gag domain-containing protein n=1 Tax=Eumeta variegata TaxID=151549 RepID=A0A4C1TP30_EUMVA|nr:hypothetical protein EVAR_93916_1 [Eumeta japonica]
MKFDSSVNKNIIELPEFYPDKNNVDVRSWITAVDICMAGGPVQGTSLMIALCRTLKGQACTWLSLISFYDMTWSELKKNFIARFECPVTPAAFLIDMNNGFPVENQCIAAYSAGLMTSVMSPWKNFTTE